MGSEQSLPINPAKKSILEEMQILEEKRVTGCQSEEDDWMMCKRMYGYNDQKCKELYLRKLESCLASIKK